MNIYLLGNGFDLAHGLCTSYMNFLYFIYNKYVCEIDEKDFNIHFLDIVRSSKVNVTEVEEDLDRKGEPIRIKSSYAVKWFISLFDYIEIESDEKFWSSLEKSLGLISYESIIDEYDNNDLEDFFEEDEYYDSLTYRWPEIAQLLKVWLREWIDSIDINQDNYNKFYKEIHSKESYFINFNYTLTLEEVYHIDSKYILHIHGKKGDNEYIFGHGNFKKNDEFITVSPTFTDNITNVERAFSKSLQIDKLDEFIKNLKVRSSENIIINVIGFSFGDVDNMYIRKLIEKFPNATWNLHKYNNQEKEYILKLKNDFNVNSKNITTSNILN